MFGCRVKITKFLIIQLSLSSCFFHPLRSRYSPHQWIYKQP